MGESKKKILIVEDDKDFLWVLKQSFSKHPFFLVYALDGEEGLAMAEKEKPDLIMIDIELPKMDGITMAKKIKEKGLNPEMIFLTGYDNPDYVSQALEIIGQADYIVKTNLGMDAIIERVKDKLRMK